MEYYAGLDVSLKEISICVVDESGKTIARGTSPADPEGVTGWFRNRDLKPRRIVHESGQLAIWLQRGMARLGLPATCIDARKAHKALSARLNKSDAADAEGLAQLARTGWFTPVHVRSEEADKLRSLVGARERMIRLRKDLEGHIRGVLKTFGIRMTGISQGRQRQSFRDQLAVAGETDPTLRSIADGFITAHATLCQAADDLREGCEEEGQGPPHRAAPDDHSWRRAGECAQFHRSGRGSDPVQPDVRCRRIPWADAKAASVRRSGLVGPRVKMRR